MRATSLVLLGLGLAACGENQTPPPTATTRPPIACLPDLDGVLTADEVPVALGVPVTYLVGRSVPVDIAGQGTGADRRWDWSTERREDTADEVAAAPLATQWYAPMFPGGQFVAASSGVSAGLDGIYAKDEGGVYLLGLASREAAPAGGRTLLRYAEPVAVLRFPLVEGAAWTEVGTVSGGMLDGLPYNGSDTYELAADATGELHLPYVRFTRALRLRAHVVARPAVGGQTTSRRQVSFWFECFGEIGRATSRLDEPAVDFTTADELRRFAL